MTFTKSAKKPKVDINAIRREEKTISGPILQQAVWKIWGYCRRNKDSLNAGVHCGIIQEVVERAANGVREKLAEMLTDTSKLRQANRTLSKEIKTYEVELCQSQAEARRLRSNLVATQTLLRKARRNLKRAEDAAAVNVDTEESRLDSIGLPSVKVETNSDGSIPS